MLTADGVVSLIGCLMGNPFINAVYIGHPGWKAMGGRIGYSAATGLMVIALSWFGIIAVLLALIPVVAISPILLYIGMLIGAQAFQTTPKEHAPAIVLALTPHLAAWAKVLIDGALAAAGTNAAAVGFDKLGNVGVLYHGLELMGGGAILTGLVLGAIGVFIIERQFVKAAAFALAGAVLTFFGFMHGEAVGIGNGLGVTPSITLGYLMVAGVLFACGRMMEAPDGAGAPGGSAGGPSSAGGVRGCIPGCRRFSGGNPGPCPAPSRGRPRLCAPQRALRPGMQAERTCDPNFSASLLQQSQRTPAGGSPSAPDGRGAGETARSLI